MNTRAEGLEVPLDASCRKDHNPSPKSQPLQLHEATSAVDSAQAWCQAYMVSPKHLIFMVQSTCLKAKRPSACYLRMPSVRVI